MPMLPTSEVPFDRAQLTRRGFIAAGIAGGFALAACSQSNSQASSSAAKMAAAIAAAEKARPHSGRTVTASLTAQQTEIDLGGITAHTLAYGNTIPGPADPGQHRRRACDHGHKPARPADLGPLARHRVAQRHGRRRARYPEHPGRPRLYLSVLRSECRYLLGPSTRRPRRGHGALSAGHCRRSDRAG